MGGTAPLLVIAAAATVACARPPREPPRTLAPEKPVGVAGDIALHAVDTLCISAHYWVEYRVAGAEAQRLTDSLERARGLAIVSRGYRDGLQVGFGAAIAPRLADTLRRHPSVSRVERSHAGCRRAVQPTYISVRDGPPSDVHRVPLELRALPSGSVSDPWDSELDSLRAVVRSSAEWRRLWPSARPRYPVPTVDFAREMVLLAAAGERHGHGRTIRIDSAFVARDTLFVVVREYEGGRTCGTTRMMVHPMHAVRVERREEEPVFIDRGVAERECR